MTFAEALKRFRQEFKLSQRDVAEALGVTRQAYQVYERDVTPSAKVLRTLAEKFGVTMDYLAGLSDTPKPPIAVGADEVARARAFREALKKFVTDEDNFVS